MKRRQLQKLLDEYTVYLSISQNLKYAIVVIHLQKHAQGK